MLQNDHIKVIANVIARLALSLLKVRTHAIPKIMVRSSRHAMRLSKHDV